MKVREMLPGSVDESVWYVMTAMLGALFLGGLFLVFSIEVAVPPTARPAPTAAAAGVAAPAAQPVTESKPAAGAPAAGAAAAGTPAPTVTPDAKARAALAESLSARLVTEEKTRNAARWAGLLWAFACCAVGAFLGFIFGIPRSLSSDTARTTLAAHSHPNGKPAAEGTATSKPEAGAGRDAGTAASGVRPEPVHTRAPSTAVNTNLEQISDWLTKIIVGVSLVNIDRVGQAMLGVGNEMAASIGGPGSRSLALAILTYFGVIGLLGGYLLTRLFLQRAFEALASTNLSDQHPG